MSSVKAGLGSPSFDIFDRTEDLKCHKKILKKIVFTD
jgi:hypothetical protein